MIKVKTTLTNVLRVTKKSIAIKASRVSLKQSRVPLTKDLLGLSLNIENVLNFIEISVKLKI